MNSHVPEEIQKRYPNIHFLGKPKQIKERIVIKAINHSLEMRYYYSFEEDFFWFIDCELPEWKMEKLT